MQRIPSSFQGALFAPLLVSLFFVFKAFCEGECLADQFAVPIFLPLVAVYKIFGTLALLQGHEFLFIILYWAFVGFLVGFIIDLLTHKGVEPVSREPVFVPPTPSIPTPPPTPTPIRTPIPTPPPAPKVAPIVFATPNIPIVPPRVPVPLVPVVPKEKPPINLLDRKEADMPH